MDLKVILFVFFIGGLGMTELVDVCLECRTAIPGIFRCKRQHGEVVLVKGNCSITRLETAAALMVKEIAFEMTSTLFMRLLRTTLRCQDLVTKGSVEINGKQCESTPPTVTTTTTTTTTTTMIPFPWPFQPQDADIDVPTTSTTSSSATTSNTTSSSSITTSSSTTTITTEAARPMQISFRASMARQYWVLTISVVVVVGAVGVGLLIRFLRRRRQAPSGIRAQTVDIEEIGPVTEAAPLSPRRRKSVRGSRSQSFESIELFSVDKKD